MNQEVVYEIERLVRFGLAQGLVGKLDAIVARNTLLDLFGQSEPYAGPIDEELPETGAFAERGRGIRLMRLLADSVSISLKQAGDGTVALRASASPVIQALVRACSCPLATTSANTHGAPAPASFSAAEPRILAGVDVAIDAQETPCQDASTIVLARGGSVEIVRHGAISDEEIYRVVQSV